MVKRHLNSGSSSPRSHLSIFSFLHSRSSLWMTCTGRLSEQLFPAGFRRVQVIFQIDFSGLQNRSSSFIMKRSKFNASSKRKFLCLQHVHIFVILQHLFYLQKRINLFILKPPRLLLHVYNHSNPTS